MPGKVNTKILDLLCMLPIAVLLFIIYKNSLDDFTAEYWREFRYIEVSCSTFYLYPSMGVWRPTRYAFLDLLYRLFGPNLVPHIAAILCLHLMDSFFVFTIVKKILRDRLVGFLAALLFATSWLHPDAMIWIPPHQDVIVAFFSLCCLIFFYKYRLNPTWSNYLLSLLAFIMAIGSKEPAVIFLPILLYLTDRYVALEAQDISSKTSTNLTKKAYLPFLVICVPWAFFIIYIFHPLALGTTETSVSLPRTLNNLLHSVTFCFAFPLFSELPRFGNINLTLVALFYFFFPVQLKRRLLLLMIAMVIVSLPASRIFSPAPRFLYLSSVFGMAIFATMLYYGSIQLFKRMKVAESLGKLFAVSCVLLLVYSNYLFLDKQMEYYNRTGNIMENLLKAVTASFPKDTLSTHLIFVNFPRVLEPKHPLHRRLPLWEESLKETLYVHYGSNKVGQLTEVILSETYSGRDTLLGKNISVQEFEELAKDKGNTVYFFNPKDDSVHNVTGKDYNFLKKLTRGS